MSDRKARLQALAARAGRKKEPADNEDGNSATQDEGDGSKNVVFRNYVPKDKSLSSQQQQSDKEEGPSALKRPRTKEESLSQSSASNETTFLSSSNALNNALQEAQQDPAESLPVTATTLSTNQTSASIKILAPKKLNWDLQRDISEKLAKLERRTQIAIVRMLKERLESEAANAVNDEVSNRGDDAYLD